MIFALMMAAAAAAQSSPSAENSAIEQAALRQLVSIHRVYVDRLTGGETAGQMRDMIISSLQNTRLFVVTENQERADATLRGSAEDLVFTESHSSSDSINARANLGTGRSNSRNGSYGGVGLGESESSHSSERRHEASAAIRLVTKDGDVIWSTIQESMGGKFRGSSADVAEKVTRKLMEDFERAKKLGNGR
jgi:hypothetical protein